MTKTTAKPRGRDATIAAIVTAARDLYRSRTPAEVTMQEIADRANVNRGLVHHYFGSKEDLFRAIFAMTSERAATEVRGAPTLLDGLAVTRSRRDGYARMLAWAMVSGMDAADFVTRSPTMAELVERAREWPLPAEDTTVHGPFDERVVVAAAIALSLGWQLYEPFMRVAGDLGDLGADDVRAQVSDLIDLMVVEALGAATP